MKIIYFTFIFFNKYNSMVNMENNEHVHLIDNNEIELDESQILLREKKIYYIINYICTLTVTVASLLNYFISNDEEKNILGVIYSSVLFLINFIYKQKNYFLLELTKLIYSLILFLSLMVSINRSSISDLEFLKDLFFNYKLNEVLFIILSVGSVGSFLMSIHSILNVYLGMSEKKIDSAFQYLFTIILLYYTNTSFYILVPVLIIILYLLFI